MKTRYDWNEIPDWANYVVTYPDGSIQAHETMPKAHVYYEHWNYGPFKNFLPKIIKQVGETPDWRESLEERPKNYENKI